MTRTRPLPRRKSLGTAYNLRPDTEQVRADTVRPGHIILEAAEFPAVITHVGFRSTGEVVLRARYIWSATSDNDWRLGAFRPEALLDRAKKGEY